MLEQPPRFLYVAQAESRSYGPAGRAVLQRQNQNPHFSQNRGEMGTLFG